MTTEETQGVTPGESPTPEVTSAVDLSAASGSVIPDTGIERPLQNNIAEFNRKFSDVREAQKRQQQTLDQVVQYLAIQAQQTQRPPAPQTPSRELTNDDLWAMAQQGDRGAFEEYQRRIAAQTYDQKHGVTTRTQTVQNQMATLMHKYPVFKDASHPLTQTFNQAYQLMVRSGMPQDENTVLDAMKTAIADRPDLVAEIHTQSARASEQHRRSASSAAGGQTGASHRRLDPKAPSTKMTPEQIERARRQGVRDPEGVMKRFQERQEKGQSAFSPLLAMALEREQENS